MKNVELFWIRDNGNNSFSKKKSGIVIENKNYIFFLTWIAHPSHLLCGSQHFFYSLRFLESIIHEGVRTLWVQLSLLLEEFPFVALNAGSVVSRWSLEIVSLEHSHMDCRHWTFPRQVRYQFLDLKREEELGGPAQSQTSIMLVMLGVITTVLEIWGKY